MVFKKRFYTARSMTLLLMLIVGGCFAFAYSGSVLSQSAKKTTGASAAEKNKAETGENKSVNRQNTFQNEFNLDKITGNAGKSRLFDPSEERLIFGAGTVANFPDLYGTINSVEPVSGGEPEIIAAADDIEPAWSPDGKKIVFISFRDGVDSYNNPELTNREVYIMNADGTDQRRLTFNNLPEAQPSFSPDGTKIIYVSRVEDENGERSGVFSINTDGSNQTPLFDDFCPQAVGRSKAVKLRRKNSGTNYYPGILGIETPNFSPDGSKILFGFGFVYSFDVANNFCSIVASTNGSSAPEPRYSPDGSRIAFVDSEEVYNPSTGDYDDVRFLKIYHQYDGYFDEYHPTQFYSTPVWSPNGDKIAYFGGSGGFYGADQISVFDLNSQSDLQVYFPAQVHFFSGLSWGTPYFNPPPMSLRILPSSQVRGGDTAQGLVSFFPSNVPPEGATIVLSVVGENGVLTLPQTTIPVAPGQSYATFDINALPRNNYKSADVVATLGANSARYTVSVSPGGTPKPDLKAISFTAPETIAAGDAAPVSWTVKNIGTVTTPNFYIDRVCFSLDDQLDAADQRLITQNQTALGAGEQRDTTGNSAFISATNVPQSGRYYLIFVTNDGPIVDEGGNGGNYANNRIVRPIQINLPDVTAENLVVPDEIEPGVNFTFSYTVHNVGAVGTSTNDSFLNKLYFSDDAIVGNADDVLIDQYFQSPLAAGQTATRTINYAKVPTVPVHTDGEKHFYVVLDTENRVKEGSAGGAGETNNTIFKTAQFYYRVPDLRVASISVAPEVETDTAFPVQWTTTNAGNKDAAAFTERVFYSPDNVVNGNDVLLGDFTLTNGLAAGQSITRIQNVTIPTAAIQTGDYYLYVVTDGGSQIDEGVNEANNVTFKAVRVRRFIRPDLKITNITAPPTAFFDQTVQVQWTVTNSGQGATNTPQWKDTVYIGTNNIYDGTRLADVSNTSYLDAGESYVATATVKIPRGIVGSYRFFIDTDSGDQVNEENENNNLSNKTITLSAPPLPDLAVTSVQAPDQAFAGQPVEINYSIKNQGTANAAYWRDRIYLSRDTTLDYGEARLIYTSDYVGAAAAGETKTLTARNAVYNTNPTQYDLPRIPGDMQGLYYVFVVTDVYDDVYEFTSENNNVNYDRVELGSPISVLITPPDLIVPNQPTAPVNATSGQTIAVNFTVKNQGAFAAAGNLRHAIYLSADQTFDADADTLIGQIQDEDSFAPAAEHPLAINTRLPDCLANGTYYLFAVADYDQRQIEFDPNFDAEANNASAARMIQITTVPPDLRVTNLQIPANIQPGQLIAVTWTVTNTGSGAANPNWSDRVILNSTNPQIAPVQIGSFNHTNPLAAGASYTQTGNVGLPSYMEGEYFISITTDAFDFVPECGTSETNNTTNSNVFAVQNNLPDLVIDQIGAPGAASVSDSFTVQFTGRNANRAMLANSPSWSDYVYLSTDATLDNGDVRLGSTINNVPLAAGQTYQRQLTVRAGNVPAGTYYLLVIADGGNNIYESASNSLPEKNNLQASAPIQFAAPNVDLQTSNVSTTQPTYSGTNATISWTVTNFGTTPTLGSSWTDYVILSRDAVYDTNDTVLRYQRHTTALAAGASYQTSASVYLPGGLTGGYNIFVIADRSNEIIENNNDNNISPPFAVNLQLPPPADLNITNITPPNAVNLNDAATFTWTVQNSGPNQINGKWTDNVYLSRDAFWDASDKLVGKYENDRTLTVSQTYTASLYAFLPPVEEGAYYVIVRTDAQNRIRENNEANNVLTSVAQTTVSITQLTINQPLSTTLGNGETKFFKYTPPPVETLIASVMTDTPTRSNELLTNFGTPVSRADYDFQSTRPGEGNQENVIPLTENGVYYSSVSHDRIPTSFAKNFEQSPKNDGNTRSTNAAAEVEPQNIVVQAKIIPFSIRQVSPTVAGNEGLATLVVEGAKFQTGATVKLVGANGTEIAPLQTRNSVNKVAAIFDLKGQSAGNYTIVVKNPNNQTTTLENGFQIVNGGGYHLRQGIIGQTTISPGVRRAHFTFTASNDGMNDAIDVPVLISIPQNAGYELDTVNFLETTTELVPPGVNPADIPIDSITDGRRLIFLNVPILRGGSSVNINLDVITDGFDGFKVAVAVLPPFRDLLAKSMEIVKNQDAARFAKPSGANAVQSLTEEECYAELLRQLAFAIAGLIGPSDECLSVAVSVGSFVADTASGAALSKYAGDNSFGKKDIVENGLNTGLGLVTDIAACLGKSLPAFKIISLAWTLRSLMAKLADCLKIPLEQNVQRVLSHDPNEKIGPAGYGAEKFVPVKQSLLYQINFENVSTATAPAQSISISDELPATLDPRTVRLREIGFKQNRFVIPDNQAFYQSRVQLGADLNNLKADVVAGVDIVNRKIFWSLNAIDPQTGEKPADPLVGLLPPNNANHDGEGYVIFTVEAVPTFPNRTKVSNTATVIFDANEPITTNIAENLLDSVIPASAVAALPPTSDSPTFTVSWSGTDDTDGSGFKGYDVYYSENGGVYFPLVLGTTGTTTSFTGKYGKNYRFYSIASDNAGNIEAAPTAPDAEIRVRGGDTEGDVAPRPDGNDGQVAVDDLIQIRRFAAGLDTNFQFNEFQRADISPLANGGDGSLTVQDIVQARRFAAGLDDVPEAAGPNDFAAFSPPVIAQNKAAASREIRPVRVSRSGNKIVVALELEAQGDEVGIGTTLNFDQTILSAPVVALGSGASGAALTVNDLRANQGRLGILLDKAPNQPFPAGIRQLVTIEFIVVGNAAATNFSFGNSPIFSQVVNASPATLPTTFSAGSISLMAPTAAAVSISGRTLTATGQGVSAARVELTDEAGRRQSVLTNSFGYYHFENLEAGKTYVVEAQSKRYQFQVQVVSPTGNIANLDFTAQ